MSIRVLGVSSLTLALIGWSGVSWASYHETEEESPPAEEPVPPVEAEPPEDLRGLVEFHGLIPLGEVPVPRPSNLSDFVRNERAAIVLGKALFWDQQVGSEGQACASCHFAAGADPRVNNQLSPGLNRVGDPTRAANSDPDFGDDELGETGSSGDAGPNYTLVAADFPFHRLEDPDDRESCEDGVDNDSDGTVDTYDDDCFDTNDVASSQGTFGGLFVSTTPLFGVARLVDACEVADGAIFGVGGIPVRKVEPRHTPTVINAVFNHRNFWDGRASNVFNGLNPLGERGLLPTLTNPNPGTLVLDAFGVVQKEQVRLENASLASQAVGPPGSSFEMACAGRTSADLGRKILGRKALAFQPVHPNDSVLAPHRNARGNGLKKAYTQLVQRAFKPEYWAGAGRFDANGDPVAATVGGYSQIEVNFPLFFGLAVQLYESTLVSDQTPFDAFLAGDDYALDDVQKFGLEIFLDEGKCINCHSGTELTGAAVGQRANQPDGNEEAVERMIMGDNGVALYDGGFYNIGVRPTSEDLGVGAEILGFPLAFSRQLSTGSVIDDFAVNEEHFEVPGDIVADERVAVDGAFKVSSLRNVELTGPYFHNGGQATLKQVVDFYDRGGDRIGNDDYDTTGFGDEGSSLDPDIQRLGLDDLTREIDGYMVTGADALVEFLLSLTDERVRYQRAPFDHPTIWVPDGHVGDELEILQVKNGRAVDALLTIPAVGADGSAVALGTFLGLDPQDE